MEIIGQTIDDAIGEAFDKAGKLLGLGYPAGPLIDHYAQKGTDHKYHFTFPKVSDLNYSFSGLKTQFFTFLTRKKILILFLLNKNLIIYALHTNLTL